MPTIRKPLALAALAAAGVAAGFALIGAPAAAAYSIDQLPGLGYSTSVVHGTDGCNTWKAGYHQQPQTDLGSDCDPGFQARVDALVAATCPCAQPATTTTAATTTDPATTTTTTDPPPPPPATTTADPVQAQIADLQKQIDQIRDQLVSLVKILVQWPGIDPGILTQLLALQTGG